MIRINKEFFLEQKAKRNILERVTKYCTNCYKELEENETIYYEIKSCNYLCKECAKYKMPKESNELEDSNIPSLF